MTEKLGCTVITPEFTGSYVSVLETKPNLNKVEKYSISMVFDEGENLDELKTCANNALINEFGADSAKWPKNLKTPFRDGNDREGDELYKNKVFVNASANATHKPGIVDTDLKPIVDPGMIYSGARYRAQINFYYFDKGGGKDGSRWATVDRDRLSLPGS